MLSKCVVFIVVFALIISCLAFAEDPPSKHPKTGVSLVVQCLRGTPRAIDGSLNDWQLTFLEPALLDTKEQIFSGVAPGAASWDGVKDLSGNFYLLWDDKNIYIAVVVKDDKLVMNKAGDTIWNADCIEIFFSEPVKNAGAATDHYQYGFNANNQKWNWCNMDGNGAKEPDYLQIASSKTADGYVCEASIEHKNMKSLTFKAGTTLGFHAVIDDTDATDREIQMTWTSLEAHNQTTGFGHAILSAQTMSVNSEAKAVLTWGAIKNQ
ncbi:MAG: Carb-bd dom fam9 protein [Candidatus Poribacteria bacterium]|nr:Carb-bd dom fam9 protein [Candidatus Poribacteria bacterium]